VDPKFFVKDPDPTFQKVPDPVSDPTLNIYSSSRTMISRSFNGILKPTFKKILKFSIL
jgi:hypothetical protein